MKIAVSLTGLYRGNIGRDPIKSIQEMQNKFDCDMYFHTWQGREHEVPDMFKTIGRFYTCPEPKMEYHPIFDPEPTTNPKHTWYRQTRHNGHKTINGTKQILSYADLFQLIPDDYDIYIKTRWDTAINKYFDFEQFYDTVLNEGPVGFMTRAGGANAHDWMSKKHRIVPKTKTNENNDWHDMLSDALIMHTREHFDPNYVFQLHREEQLLGAEWGWWQVMSKPFGGEIHTSVYGGVTLIR